LISENDSGKTENNAAMKVSLNWLKDYLDIELDAEKVSEVLTDIGLEVEGVEEVEHIKGGLRGIVIGYVKTCEKHPDSDHLSVTTVDLGVGVDAQIVCGASNVAAGQKVLVAPVGTTLYTPEGETFEILRRKIRNIYSEGMICSEDEIGLGSDHSGIVVLPEDAPLGKPARDYYTLSSDYVFEIGLTPNRSDATNHLGVARDLAAALKINYEHSGELRVPSVAAFAVAEKKHQVEVVVENPEACPRYAGVVLDNVVVGDSPDWLKQKLQAVGVRSINNVVDITNFILHELGQPLHAFDLDKIGGKKVVVKTLAQDTAFVSLDENTRKLHEQDLMICDGNSAPMCIGGVFGGLGTGVTGSTTRIFLESAHFHPQWIRRTSMRHNLRTDAAKVFEKGSDPNIAVYALKRAALLMQELAGATIASEVVDLYPHPVEPRVITVTFGQIRDLIGVAIEVETVRAILEAMDMEIVAETPTAMEVAVPTNKFDVTRPVDLIEEILRIYGFNKVEMPTQIKTEITIGEYPSNDDLVNTVSAVLTANGFFEMMAVSLTKSHYFTHYDAGVTQEELIYINNTSNVHLDIMRPSMVFSGLEMILHNQNRQRSDVRAFEFGKSYRFNAEKKIIETGHLTLFLSGAVQAESWHHSGEEKVNFYVLKAFVELILHRLGINDYQSSELSSSVFLQGLRYHRGDQHIVNFGQVHPTLVKEMDIREAVFFAEFNWDNVKKTAKKQKTVFSELNKFPNVRRDLALVIDNSVKFEDIALIARKIGKKLLKEINLFDVYENENQLGKGKKSYAVSFIFEDYTKTLQDKEVDKVIKKLIEQFEQQLGAVIRR
jgi:phenylalanyl-tRNA synthetase beta chain